MESSSLPTAMENCPMILQTEIGHILMSNPEAARKKPFAGLVCRKKKS